MALLVDNDVTGRVLETADAVDVMADAITQLANGEAAFQPRTDLVSPKTEGGDDYGWGHQPEWYAWGSLLGAISDPPRLALRFESAERVVTTDNRPLLRYVIGTEEDDRQYERRHPEWFEERHNEPIGDVLTGDAPGRRDDGTTIVYDNISAGIQFAAVGNLVYERAKERGLGVEIPLSWFQQDVRN